MNPSRSFRALAESCLSVAPFHLAMEALRLEAPVREGKRQIRNGGVIAMLPVPSCSLLPFPNRGL